MKLKQRIHKKDEALKLIFDLNGGVPDAQGEQHKNASLDCIPRPFLFGILLLVSKRDVPFGNL